MSGWKEVKKKKKKGGRPQDSNRPNFNMGGGQQPKKKKKKKNNQQQGKGPAILNRGGRGPIGASGAPRLAKQMSQQKRNKGAPISQRKKYTNDHRVTSQKQSQWFDPNQLHDAGDEDGYYYHGKDTSQYISQDLADKIRRNRDKQGLSRKEFAQAINEDVSLVNKYERAQVVPNQKILQKMSRVLKINLGRAGKTRQKKKKSHFYKRD